MRKGNYARRLGDAVAVIENRRAAAETEELKRRLNDDDTDALRRVSEMLQEGAGGQRSPGLVRH